MSQRFSVHAFLPLRRERVVEVTQFETMQFSAGLFGQGSGSLTLPWYSRDSLTALIPNATGLVVDDGGQARWSGWVRNREINPDQGTIRFGCVSWFDYYDRRWIRSRSGMAYADPAGGDIDVVFTAVDQFRIVSDILAHAAQVAGAANLGLVLRLNDPGGSPLSGVLRTRTYHVKDRTRIAQAISELAEQTGGFDYMVNVEWDTTVEPWQPNLFLDLYYPRKGNTVGGIVVEQGTNANLTRITDDGTEQANPVSVLGTTTGDIALSAEATDPTALHPDGLYPYLELEVRYGSDGGEDPTALQRRADAELAIRRQPLRTVTAVLAEQPRVFHYGDAVVGDSVRTLGTFGGFAIDERLRIVSENATVTPQGLADWSIDLATDDATLRV